VVPEQVKLIEVTVCIIRSSRTANRGRVSGEDMISLTPILEGVETPSVVSREWGDFSKRYISREFSFSQVLCAKTVSALIKYQSAMKSARYKCSVSSQAGCGKNLFFSTDSKAVPALFDP
jgi:hypothetical protein